MLTTPVSACNISLCVSFTRRRLQSSSSSFCFLLFSALSFSLFLSRSASLECIIAPAEREEEEIRSKKLSADRLSLNNYREAGQKKEGWSQYIFSSLDPLLRDIIASTDKRRIRSICSRIDCCLIIIEKVDGSWLQCFFFLFSIHYWTHPWTEDKFDRKNCPWINRVW